MARLALAGVTAVWLGGTTACAAPEATGADEERMAQLFDMVCLRVFPDEAATDATMERLGGIVLAPTAVRKLLHDDQGRGWQLQRPEATYLVTIEAPPWHACAVRRMTGHGFPQSRAYATAIERYARARQRRLTAPVVQTLHRADGLDVQVSVQQVPGWAVNGLADTLMLFTTDYHGTYAGPLAADTAAPGIEVRFVHQLRSMGEVP